MSYHSDDRRTLEDWPEAKVLTIKKDCMLGNHFHKIKTEKFLLLSGEIHMIVDGVTEKMQPSTLYTVLPGQAHSFMCKSGSVLIGLCSHVYDKSDDYEISNRIELYEYE